MTTPSSSSPSTAANQQSPTWSSPVPISSRSIMSPSSSSSTTSPSFIPPLLRPIPIFVSSRYSPSFFSPPPIMPSVLASSNVASSSSTSSVPRSDASPTMIQSDAIVTSAIVNTNANTNATLINSSSVTRAIQHPQRDDDIVRTSIAADRNQMMSPIGSMRRLQQQQHAMMISPPPRAFVPIHPPLFTSSVSTPSRPLVSPSFTAANPSRSSISHPSPVHAFVAPTNHPSTASNNQAVGISPQLDGIVSSRRHHRVPLHQMREDDQDDSDQTHIQHNHHHTGGEVTTSLHSQSPSSFSSHHDVDTKHSHQSWMMAMLAPIIRFSSTSPSSTSISSLNVRTMRFILAALLAMILLRSALHSFQNRDKYDSFTIVAIMRDVDSNGHSPSFSSRSSPSLSSSYHLAPYQHIALASWSHVVVGSNIMVFVDDASHCASLYSIVPNIRCELIPCWHRDLHEPLISCIIDVVHTKATTDIIVLIPDGDIVLYSDLGVVIDDVASQRSKFVLVARRTNVVIPPIMIEQYKSESFAHRLRVHAQRSGVVHPPTSSGKIDVFVYTKNAMAQLDMGRAKSTASSTSTPTIDIVSTSSVHTSSSATSLHFPPFLACIPPWDNWLLSQFILDTSVSVIDYTLSGAMLLHQERGRVRRHVGAANSASDNRDAVVYNSELSRSLSGNDVKIGLIDNVEFVYGKDCGSSESSSPSSASRSCRITPNPVPTDVVLFTKRASDRGWLVILTVNHNYINLALNWVCWAERIKFENYILIAEDQSSASTFQSRGVPVIVRSDAPYIKRGGDYGSVDFQATMTFRTEFLMSVLLSGFHFVTADMDGLWIGDPLLHFDDHADLQGQMHKLTKISGGLVAVRATTYGRYFWQMVIECQRGNAIFLATAAVGSYEPATYTEQYCINELSLGLIGQSMFTRTLLDPFLFPDGKSFFTQVQPQLHGVVPAIIHNNWVVGTAGKIARLKQWGLESVDEVSGECIQADRWGIGKPRLGGGGSANDDGDAGLTTNDLPPSTSSSPSHSSPIIYPLTLKIRIFTRTNAVRLQKCLDALALTIFDADDDPRRSITVEVSVDHPGMRPTEDEVRGWNDVHGVADRFVWNTQSTSKSSDDDASKNKRADNNMESPVDRVDTDNNNDNTVGDAIIIDHPHPLGLGGQFYRGWIPDSSSDDEVMLYLSDSTILAPGWYQMFKQLMARYYTNAEEFDERLIGISLVEAKMIVGETYVSRFTSNAKDDASDIDMNNHGDRSPRDVLSRQSPPSSSPSSSFYKYQYFNPIDGIAIFLFPQHWRLLQSWLTKKQVDTINGVSLATSSSPSTSSAVVVDDKSSITACVPCLISNRWWSSHPRLNWYQWMLRFMYEHGSYIMYNNYDDQHVWAMDGNGAKTNDGAGNEVGATSNTMLIDITHPSFPSTPSYLISLPSSSLIPVFDFAFRVVPSPSLLSWRPSLHPPSLIPECWTLSSLSSRLASDRVAADRIESDKVDAKRIALEEKKRKEQEKKDIDKKDKAKKEEKERKEKDEKDAINKKKNDEKKKKKEDDDKKKKKEDDEKKKDVDKKKKKDADDEKKKKDNESKEKQKAAADASKKKDDDDKKKKKKKNDDKAKKDASTKSKIDKKMIVDDSEIEELRNEPE